jgi:PAS domain S-box-containing protein
MAKRITAPNIASIFEGIATGNVLKGLRTDWRLALLDMALLIVAILLIFTEPKILFLHVIFILLTFGAFYWKSRAFALRAILCLTVATGMILTSVLAGETQTDELIEIPALVVVLVGVFAIARQRRKAQEALHMTLEEARQRQAEVSALLTSSHAVLAYREFEDAARSIFDSCKRLTGATAGYVALLTEDGAENEVLFLDSGGVACSVDPTLPMPIRGLREEAYRTGKTVYENDFAGSEWTLLLPEGHMTLNSVLFAPLVLKGIAVGLLGLANKPGGFTENDAHLAAAFGELAVIALFNSRTLESLQNSEERFRSVAQTAGEAIITIDSRGSIVFWNKSAVAMFGFEQDEVIGQPLTLIMPKRFCAVHRDGVERVVSTGQSHMYGKTVELVGLRRDGREFPMELSISSWKIREEMFFTGIVHDITDRKQAEEARRRANEELESRVVSRTAELTRVNVELVREITQRQQAEETLRESEERYRQLVELSFEAIAIHSQGEIRYANPPVVNLLGAASAKELVGKPIRDLIHPDYWNQAQARMQQVSQEGKGAPLIEAKLIRLDGSSVDVEVVSIPIIYLGQPAVQSVIHDITARKQAETAREKERARIARDLHDSLGHSLAYLHLKLDDLASQDTLEKPQRRLDLARMRDVANEAYELVRSMLAASLPTYSSDLATALLVPARAAGRRGNFKVQITSQGQPRPLPPIVQQQSLYVLQEALANVEKHASARQVDIGLVWSEETLTITLADDGQGFDARRIQSDGHFGLAIMQARAQEINGRLSLTSRPGAGTKLTLRIPLLPDSQHLAGDSRSESRD